MSTKEKLISHVMKEEPVGSQSKVTVVGVGMVGMASAISILLKVRGGSDLPPVWVSAKINRMNGKGSVQDEINHYTRWDQSKHKR